MPITVLDRPRAADLPPRRSDAWKPGPIAPVTVEEDAIRFRPAQMELGHYYVAEFKGLPYLYRRVSDSEVEIYGLAEAPD